MEIVVGTYDEVLIGFRAVKIGKAVQLETNFTDNSHTGCIKCITISNKGILASGSTDETIRLLNIRKKKEIGSLVHHSGTVTSLEFQKNFLFSTSEDKTLCLWKAANWECLKTFRGHKYEVNCVSVHPSGKLALTVGNDRKLMTWNLITGRSAYITNIKEVAEIVKWSPGGELYLIVSNNKIDIYCVETAAVKSSVKSEFRVNQLDFYSNEVFVYAGEGGDVIFYNITEDKVVYTCNTGTNRIKGMIINKSPIDEDKQALYIGSSDGRVQIYDISETEGKLSTTLLVDHNASFRITCMAVYNNTSGKSAEQEETLAETEDMVNDDEEEGDDESESDSGNKINEDDLDLVTKSLLDDDAPFADSVRNLVPVLHTGPRFLNESEKVMDNKKKMKSSLKDKKKKKSISFSDKVSVKRDLDEDEEDLSDKKMDRKKKKAKIDGKINKDSDINNEEVGDSDEGQLKLRETVTVVQENDKLEMKKQKSIQKWKLNKKIQRREKRRKMKETENSEKFHMKRVISDKPKGKKENKHKGKKGNKHKGKKEKKQKLS